MEGLGLCGLFVSRLEKLIGCAGKCVVGLDVPVVRPIRTLVKFFFFHNRISDCTPHEFWDTHLIVIPLCFAMCSVHSFSVTWQGKGGFLKNSRQVLGEGLKGIHFEHLYPSNFD